MSIEIKVPILPESVSDATIATWHRKPGELVKRDEHLVDIETDKVILEVVAPEDGKLESITRQQGETVVAEEVIGLFEPFKIMSSESTGSEKQSEQKVEKQTTVKEVKEAVNKAEAKINSKVESLKQEPAKKMAQDASAKTSAPDTLSPSMRRKLAENKQEALEVTSAQKLASVSSRTSAMAIEFKSGERVEKRVPMTRLRARIAERLVEAQHNAAILTTFNEINMHPIITLRQRYKETFEKTYGVRLGFMSFFTMAVVEALKHFPIINASVDGGDIVYHGYYDIGIAISSSRGLVVPVLKNAETLTMADIEKQIVEYAAKAQNGQLGIEEITGGTFTITNGGVFGSLMATPILNPPQSAILGMHKIQERPVVENGQVVVRPMMYAALSYDHRIIDGADSVRFLVTVKELLEDPARLALGI